MVAPVALPAEEARAVIFVSPHGWLEHEGWRVPCALGRSGVVVDKREGDGGTPAGSFPLRRVLWRADRLARPVTTLPCSPISPGDAWCDDPSHPDYNRPVRLPHPGGTEGLWREDGLCDVVVVLGHNDDPPVPGLGSAIFLHVARPDLGPTAGCVAVERGHLLRLLESCAPSEILTVAAP